MKLQVIDYAEKGTSAVKNLFDIISIIRSNYKEKDIITNGNLQRLRQAVEYVCEVDRENGIHSLNKFAAKNLKESYDEYVKYAGSPLGKILFDNIEKEAEYYRECVDDFSQISRNRGRFL